MSRARARIRGVVVALAGLAFLLGAARFALRRIQRNARNQRAYLALNELADDAVKTYKDTGRICATGAKRYVPNAVSEIVATGSEGYASSPQEWADPADVAADRGFPCLHYVAPPSGGYGMHFRIGYTGSGTGTVGSSFEGTADGDWNGDGGLSFFRITGVVNGHLGIDISEIEVTNPDD